MLPWATADEGTTCGHMSHVGDRSLSQIVHTRGYANTYMPAAVPLTLAADGFACRIADVA
eukprot:6475365-Amphidinium_carterae.1